jgi:CubicO group peptidase (beta-lactamase class C family)
MALLSPLRNSDETICRRTVLSVVALAMLTYPAVAQISAGQKQGVDNLARSYIADHHVPGLSLAVVVDGRVALAEGYGLADIENDVPATADTVYRIASVSKPVTATAAMKLVEAGKLDLDAPMQKYCPAFPAKQWTMTTRQLLTHQSGIRDYRDDAESINTRHYKSINEALNQFAGDPLQFEPGTKMQYTSYGYIVLGCVIEGASSESYDSYMRQAVFEPSHMTVTRLDDVFAIIPHRAHGYVAGPDGTLQNAIFVDVSNKPPGSGINSSANDMGNFVAALYAGQLVSKASLARMLTPANTRDGKPTIYGFGFFLGGPVGNYHGIAEVGHGGDQQGYSSVLYLLPEKKFGVVALTNIEGQNNSSDLIELSRKIYDICSPK